MEALGYAVDGPKDKFHPWVFQRREVGPNDVLVKVEYCGICHSDIHHVRGEWKDTEPYPMVPGHEIVGTVTQVGANVTKLKVGDHAGVGCMVDSCRKCEDCNVDNEQLCKKMLLTYAAFKEGSTVPTYGGYSNIIVVDEKFMIKVSDKFTNLAPVAPLLCAGITVYSPLAHFKSNVVGKKVGVIGLGGLGHMGVKIAAAMGAEVTVFSTSPSKREDALKLGAKHFVIFKEEEEMKKLQGTFSLILNTVSAQLDFTKFIKALGNRGVFVLVGASPEPLAFQPLPLLFGNKIIAGSLIGGIKETQEMMDFCAEHNITSDIELISANQIDEAYERTIKSDVKYRFVIDISTFKK